MKTDRSDKKRLKEEKEIIRKQKQKIDRRGRRQVMREERERERNRR